MHEALARAADDVEKINANLEPELLTMAEARKLMVKTERDRKASRASRSAEP